MTLYIKFQLILVSVFFRPSLHHPPPFDCGIIVVVASAFFFHLDFSIDCILPLLCHLQCPLCSSLQFFPPPSIHRWLVHSCLLSFVIVYCCCCCLPKSLIFWYEHKGTLQPLMPCGLIYISSCHAAAWDEARNSLGGSYRGNGSKLRYWGQKLCCFVYRWDQTSASYLCWIKVNRLSDDNSPKQDPKRGCIVIPLYSPPLRRYGAAVAPCGNYWMKSGTCLVACERTIQKTACRFFEWQG